MEITQKGGHYITVCGCCDVLISNKIGFDELLDQHKGHLDLSPKCRAWYDSLPTLNDLRGIAPDCTGGLSSEEFIRRQRVEADDD